MGEFCVRGGDDLSGVNGSVDGAGLANGRAGYRNSAGHLDGREQRVESGERRGRHGDPDDGQRGFGRDHSREMRCPARPYDDNFEAALDG